MKSCEVPRASQLGNSKAGVQSEFRLPHAHAQIVSGVALRAPEIHIMINNSHHFRKTYSVPGRKLSVCTGLSLFTSQTLRENYKVGAL